jgi:hypothetical protein
MDPRSMEPSIFEININILKSTKINKNPWEYIDIFLHICKIGI